RARGRGARGPHLGPRRAGWLAACGAGALRLTRLQLPGGKPLNFTDLFNSRREKFAIGTVLGQ
ncbi:methionyl-tRNA formyltransferase, partial [Pseudomonas syringae]|nr:methionyl-tRNA formyltransferase [Pseudomonas syringae]